ncbi:MAG: SprT-like domain-containing protein [Bacteroidetes bacterium]|nr:SprT-like domain-containing protein [Bacteroidota bacterium]
MTELKEILAKYIPENALNQIVNLIATNNVQLNITRNRRTKLGDYRPPQNGYLFHRISVNYNLNEYEFLITLIHEFAHLFVWNKHKNKVEPHGKEFKTTYYSLLHQFVEMNIFPEDVKAAIQKIEASPENAKLEMGRALQKYSQSNQNMLLVEEVPLNANFKTPDGRTFQKLEKLRKRYKCLCLNDKRKYLFHPLAKVISPN